MHSSGFAESLLNNGAVPISEWGTDLDIRHCLGSQLTDEKTIAAGGIYILAPKSLTESHLAIQDPLETALQTVQAQNISDQVSLRIPVNCGNNHWRLVKIEIIAQEINSVTLWDSLADRDNHLVKTIAYQNLQKAVNNITNSGLQVKAQSTGIQNNTYSCMDHVLQEAYRNAGINNQITKANNNTHKLRYAVVKQIIANHPNLGPNIAGNLELKNNSFQLKNKNTLLTAAQIYQILQKNKAKQLAFDAALATNLQNLYTKNPTSDDAKLLEIAFDKTAKKLVFFAPAAQPKSVGGVGKQANLEVNDSKPSLN